MPKAIEQSEDIEAIAVTGDTVNTILINKLKPIAKFVSFGGIGFLALPMEEAFKIIRKYENRV